jgi:hypothetical protein
LAADAAALAQTPPPPAPPVVEPLTGVAKMKAERAAAVAALTSEK